MVGAAEAILLYAWGKNQDNHKGAAYVVIKTHA